MPDENRHAFDVVSPVDGRTVAHRHHTPPSRIDEALETAVRAQGDLRTLSLETRQDLCRRLILQLRAQEPELSDEITWQIGRPRDFAGAELNGVEERAGYMIDVAGQALATRHHSHGATLTAELHAEAAGVIFAIVPWNYPFLTAVNSLVPALVAGNAVILKPSPLAPLSGERLAAAAAAAGFPDGSVQAVHLANQDTLRVIRDRRVDHVVFTGSVEVGRLIGAEAGRSLTAVTLELGGNDAAYVRPDADIAATAAALAEGAFFNSGQSCCAVERIFVARAVVGDFVDAFVSAKADWPLGDPFEAGTRLGPMVSAEAAARLRGMIDGAEADGAIRLGPEPATALPTPAYVPAHALLLEGTGHAALKQELFGPLACVVPVASDDDAVARINDSDYGLTASIWTEDPGAAKRLGERLDVGTVYQNRCDYLDPCLAWSGRKNSGIGLSLSVLGYHQLTRPKSYHLRSTLRPPSAPVSQADAKAGS